MTVSATSNRVPYTGDGATTVFPYTFRIFANTDLKVYVAGVLKTITTHYTVSGVGEDAGGNVTMLTAPGNQVAVLIVRELPLTQLTDYVEASKFPAETHESVSDRAVMILQQLLEKIGRGLKFATTSLKKDYDVPEPVASKVIGFSSDALSLELYDNPAAAEAAASASADAAAASQASATASAATATTKASDASASAAAAAASAASVNLPTPNVANKFLQVNAGGTGWELDVVPADAAAATHIAASDAVHGLPASVSVLGNRSAAGEFVQRGDLNPDAVSGSAGSMYGGATAVTFPVAFSSAPYVSGAGSTQSSAMLSQFARSITTTGFTMAYLGGSAALDSAEMRWIALGK